MYSRTRTLVFAGLAILGGCSAEPADPPEVGVVTQAASRSQEAGRVTICHVSEHGSNAITVAAAAIPAHLRHGDALGECASGCTTGSECSDGEACTSDECLADGTCEHVPVQCDDGDPCTIDACAPELGCTTAPASNVTCNDGNDCTASDVCANGVCRGAPITGCCQSAADCDDGNGCSVDACVSGACVNTPLDCTVPDACVVGFCDPTLGACGSTPVTCDDGVVCTADSCDPTLGCVSQPTTQPPGCEIRGGLRITFDYELDGLSIANHALIVDALEDARIRFSQLLEVASVSGNLVLEGSSCGGYAFPPEALTEGIADTDLYILVQVASQMDSVLAGMSCERDSKGRPVSGVVFVDPAKLDKLSSGVVAHEVIHVLGFSAWVFENLGALSGNPSLEVLKTFTERGHSVKKLVTPNALRKAREHFGCDSLNGVELEDGGGAGTAGSHLEERIYRDELMSSLATSGYSDALSGITLGFLEDTGWYRPDYSLAEPLIWGKGEGCSFALTSCSSWSDDYFCTEGGGLRCDFARQFTGFCDLTTYGSALPSHFQYFPSPTQGGMWGFADYCPSYTAYSNLDCDNPSNNGQSFASNTGQQYGENSRCFESTLTKSGHNGFGVGCYPASCESGVLSLQVDGVFHACPAGGGSLCDVPGHEGCLTCPPASEICGD